jgi:methylmalonyl-CoA/ethylmalonyl-CoA epimerase
VHDVAEHRVRWMFHSTCMVSDYDLAVSVLGRLVNLQVLEYSESTEPGIGRRGGMTWVGDNSIEIGQPLGEGAAARFVEQHGGGVHSIALQVEDIDATIEFLTNQGIRIAARPRPEMCFTDPAQTEGIFFQWSSFELEVDPRFGAPLPGLTTDPAISVLRHAFVGAVVEDPTGAAGRLAKLLATDVTFEDQTSAEGHPIAGISVGDCTVALYAMPEANGMPLWGRTYERPRTMLLALLVPDLDEARQALDSQQIATVRSDLHLVVVEPVAGIQLALTDRLLPGDPRVST